MTYNVYDTYKLVYIFLNCDMYEVSIIIPTYNSSSYILENLEYIYSKVEKSLSNVEYVIINDSGDERVLHKLRKFKGKRDNIVLVNLDGHHGQQLSVQAGLYHSRGEYLLTFDDDLQNSPEDIHKLYKYIAEKPDVNVVNGASIVIGER